MLGNKSVIVLLQGFCPGVFLQAGRLYPVVLGAECSWERVPAVHQVRLRLFGPELSDHSELHRDPGMLCFSLQSSMELLGEGFSDRSGERDHHLHHHR